MMGMGPPFALSGGVPSQGVWTLDGPASGQAGPRVGSASPSSWMMLCGAIGVPPRVWRLVGKVVCINRTNAPERAPNGARAIRTFGRKRKSVSLAF
eukprot:scaffold15922_cov111-Isochrysis_galbana.AAC.9